ncbi:hypothetical protein GWI33_007331 [Rhynchophorus ferrugineus]|uniref:Luciferin 4-monooxygenase n=1 Tax=Rhynchophorus ferrugineus TaxID=354439 RepID=A0A834MID6_RHYFE|nr:hypothetical protein GWI33_007331 [Rhynchophorus ferrugineus]
MFSRVARKILIQERCRSSKHFLNRRGFSSSCRRDKQEGRILKGPGNIELPKTTIPDFVFSHCEKFPDLVCSECPITKKKYTFRQVRDRSKNLGKVLRKKFGLNRGDAVLIFLPNLPEFQITTLGCMTAGLVVSTANCLYTADEISRQIVDSSSKLIITTVESYEVARKSVEKAQKRIPIICIRTRQDQLLPRDAIDFEEVSTTVLDIPDLEPSDPEDVAVLPYSSGTTGLPKGVRLSHHNIVSNLMQMNDSYSKLIRNVEGNEQDVTLAVLPMFHIYGFTITTLFMMIKGSKVLPLQRFSPDTYIQSLKEYNVDYLFLAPPLVLFLTLHPDVLPEYLKKLRFAFSGAAPLGPLDEEKFLDKVGRHVLLVQAYGLTETSPLVAANTRFVGEDLRDVSQGSIGHVVANTEAKIVKPGDPTATPLGALESGELLVRGPQVMQGYHNNQKATDEILQDGWLRTGDLAHYNERDFIFITDRVKELIKVKGFQVAPAELEELLRDHPKVADAAVIGIPDMVSGELPRAYIQLKENTNTDDINRFLNDKVAKYKRLEGGIEFVKEIPKNSAGKILRRQLKERYLQEQQA